MKSIVILTGNEIRHQFFRKILASEKNLNVLSTFCEGNEKSLGVRVTNNKNSSYLEKEHVKARTQSEKDFFGACINTLNDKSSPVFIKKGEINDSLIVSRIIDLNPDLLVCYGSSLIKSELLEIFKGKFINVHLGLSPYYRGSGTNIWPLINNEPEMLGATFMYLDSGIDTGKIIHQIRAEIFLGDSPHTIGNRLIKKMTYVYIDIILKFDDLDDMHQHKNKDGKLYLMKDFDQNACGKLYDNFNKGLVNEYLTKEKNFKYIIQNPKISS